MNKDELLLACYHLFQQMVREKKILPTCYLMLFEDETGSLMKMGWDEDYTFLEWSSFEECYQNLSNLNNKLIAK